VVTNDCEINSKGIRDQLQPDFDYPPEPYLVVPVAAGLPNMEGLGDVGAYLLY
jgi:hypothetical protein